ncbi:hypothetical protein Sango_1983100 [Sesamum angolense]|uniref:Uncharacterized protein n=1 Tax=Sesamum angolense TaxID=2727404 RepID=A0AAE1WEV6_9LAMI|nr:hypothetical protein Sango_1983100 [Sesamum angolense]
MTGANRNSEPLVPKARALGNTEQNWCRAVSSGTGIAVLALQMARPPSQASTLHKILQKLQNSHPLLRSKLCNNLTTNKTLSFHTSPPTSPPQIPRRQINFASAPRPLRQPELRRFPGPLDLGTRAQQPELVGSQYLPMQRDQCHVCKPVRCV